MKKCLLVLIMGIALTGLVFAAGRQDSGAGLTFHHFSTEQEVRDGNAGATAFRYAIAEWEKAHRGVKLEQTILDNDSWKVRTAALAAANDLPDVPVMQGMWTKEWVDNGLVVPLDDLLRGKGYKDGLFAPFRVNGKIYGIPILATGSCTVVVYDSKLWADAGFANFPETWADVEKANAYFKSKGLTTFSFGNGGQWQVNSTFLSAVGDRFTGEKWFFDIINHTGGAAFTDKAFVDALRFTQSAFRTDNMFNKDFNAVNNEVARDYFVNGQSAAYIGGNWDVTYIGEHADPALKGRIRFAVIPQPTGATASYKTHAAGNGMALTINSKLSGEKLANAQDLILYITGKTFADKLATDFAQTAPYPAGNVNLSKFDGYTQEFYKFNANTVCPIYDSFMTGEITSVLNIGLQEMLNGTKTPEQVARETQAVNK